MKLTIRKGMFETNSSAMHSIILGKDFDLSNDTGCDFLQEDAHYILNVDDEGYTRGPGRLLTSPFEKATFLIALFTLHNLKGENYYLEKPVDWDNRWSNFKNYIEDLFKKRKVSVEIKEPTIIVETEDGQSYTFLKFYTEGFGEYFGEYEEELLSENVIENLIFNPQSFVIIGGDEYSSCFQLFAFVANNLDMNKYIVYPKKSSDDFIKKYSKDYWYDDKVEYNLQLN